MSNAAKLPSHIKYDSSLSKTVISNLKVIVIFYIRILSKEPCLSCKFELYNQVFRFRRLAWCLEQEEYTKNIAQELLSVTEIFRGTLYKEENFEIYWKFKD